jgi:L-malate glycosyltransferase
LPSLPGAATKQRLAVVGPMDVKRLATDLDLEVVGPDDLPAGHGGHSVTELVVGMAGQFDQLDLITLDPGLKRPVELRGGKVRLAVGPFRPRARSRSLDLFSSERAFIADRLRQWRPGAVSAHWTYEYALGALDSGSPTVVTVRDWGPTILRHAPDAYRVIRLGMQAATFARGRTFVAVSPYMAHRVERFSRRPCQVIANALGDRWFVGEVAPLKDARVVAINSGFGRRKNVSTLLEAWPRIHAAVPGSELVLVGSGHESGGAAHRWAAARGLTDGVEFRGSTPREHLRELLRSATVFVHPALEESFGMVILEAMATGVPVIGGASSGAVPWILGEGAGVLVNVKRAASIAAATIQLLDDRALAAHVGAAGRDRAERMFTVRHAASSYLSLLASTSEELPIDRRTG